jgi:cell wall-associated NlpC family hydrolase
MALLAAGPVVLSAPAKIKPRPIIESVAPKRKPHRHAKPVRPDPRRIRARMTRAVLRAARKAIGTPYVYGGEWLHHGFDCSGLVQWAYRHAGVSLPRTSDSQHAAIPHVGRHHLQPGDLLFFYPGISHVAIYVGHGRMIEAPHTGLRVRTMDVYWRYLVGAGRPRIPHRLLRAHRSHRRHVDPSRSLRVGRRLRTI